MGCCLPLLFRIVLCLHFLHFHFLSSSSSLHSKTPLCHPDQSSALLQFKNSFHVDITTYADWDWDCDQVYPKTTTWENGTDCCSWMGVTCDSMSGHVIGLDLDCSGIGDKFHPNNTLFRLTYLQRLNLAHNHFYGSQLSSQLGGFVSLTHLNLSYSYFEGEIPSQISYLSRLVSLDLSRNANGNGDGVLTLKETTWKRLVQNATILREIFLDGIDMSSISLKSLSFSAEWSSSVVALSLVSTGIRGHLTSDILCSLNPQELYLSGNEIQVHLPMLNCSASLSILDLSYCSLQRSSLSFLANLTHLTFLDLSGDGLNGPIPSFLSSLQHLTHLYLSFNELSGSIPSSLSSLQHLTYLGLSANKLTGFIPSSLLNLQHLIHLDLSRNQLNGQIPNALGGLTKLQTLSLRFNNLGGQLPSSLFTLTQLSFLDCSYNKFKGPLPNKITGFSYLTQLLINDNLLNGTIPSWCFSLPFLTYLDLRNNQLTGHVGVISSSYLHSLYLCDNKLQGNIPESIFNLTNLNFLCLSSNNWSDIVPFPRFSKLQNLITLSLSGYAISLKSETNVNYSFPNLSALQLLSNNLIDYSNFSGNFPNLVSLDLSNNKLQGKVPKWIRDMDSLFNLILSGNQLTSIDQFPWYNLEYLDLSSNLMTDDISSVICNVTSLNVINLSQNKFRGTFPQCLAKFSSLEVLDLQMNKLHGTLPNTFSMKNCWLKTLNVYGNQLEGHLPKSLSSCTNLQVLNLGNNKIEDTFPHWLPNLPSLQVLVLRANKLFGPIVSLKTKNPFFKLIIFDISCNNFSGPFPKSYITNFQAMTSIGQAKLQSIFDPNGTSLKYIKSSFGQLVGDIEPEYDESVIATIKGVSITFMKIPAIFVNIDLSNNKFEGEIPNVIGELDALKGLNLSHNRLIGPIPHSMGNLTNLESFDLSSNMLTGGIPIELTNLNSLEVLNLSRNHLVGAIPQGKQFNTFSNDSYKGNMGLCGLPLSVQCNKDPEKQSPSSPPTFEAEEKFGFGWKPVAIGYGCGMLFGVGLGCCVLLIGKPLWLVRMVGGGPNKRVKSSRRSMRTHGNRARLN